MKRVENFSANHDTDVICENNRICHPPSGCHHYTRHKPDKAGDGTLFCYVPLPCYHYNPPIIVRCIRD